MKRLVGAYVCPRGVFGIECRRRREGLEVIGTFGHAGTPATITDAAAQLTAALASAGVAGAQVAIAIRGFDVVHQMLSFPPARDAVLTPIVDREIRRLEPQVTDPIVAWTAMAPEETGAGEPTPQRQLLVAACPRDAVAAFEKTLGGAGHRLLHLTVLPAAVQRLEEELDASPETTAFVAPLPDGAFLGFFLGGALRLVVEPPLAPDEQLDPASLGEEIELGAMFVRQQFRGAQLERLAVAQGGDAFAEAEARLLERLQVPVRRLDVHAMSAAALVAMGAVLDAQSAAPLSLGGTVAARRRPGAQMYLHRASLAAVGIAAVVAVWTTFTALSARAAAAEVVSARHRLEQESFGMAPLRETAGQRRLVRDARSAIRIAASDRADLQRALAGIAASASGPVLLDSLHLDRGTGGWVAAFTGSVTGTTNGAAVQALHDFYRLLPSRLPIDALSLDQLEYDESGARQGRATVRFRLSFELISGEKDK